MQQLASSIKEFGFINPVIVSADNGVIAGHGRIMAAQLMGLEKVPCIVESHLTETQKRAYILADNRLAEKAGWDEELLQIELEELGEEGFDLDLMGFSLDDLDALLEMGEAEEKNTPAEQKGPQAVDSRTVLKLIIDCKTEAEQEELFNEFTRRGFVCRVQSL